MAYHFLHHGAGAKQAEWCFMNVGPNTPLMLDVEPTAGSAPNLGDIADFVAEYRKLGGTVHLLYLPHWYWQELGSPSLKALADADFRLVSSDYVTYSADGPGWEGYGGASPAVWQFSDATRFNGFECDFNAYRGTLAQLKSIARTGHLPADPPPANGKALNPVDNIWASHRYTQADVGWNKAAGAKSYRVVLKQGSKLISTEEVKGNKLTLHNLTEGTKYTVSVLALPAKVSDTISGRARVSFTTK